MTGNRISNDVGYSPEILLGRAHGSGSIVSKPTRMQDAPTVVSIIPFDYSAYKNRTPIAHPFGILRLPRDGQAVVYSHAAGHTQVPIALGGHLFNFELASGFADTPPTDGNSNPLLADPHDFAVYHDETYAFMRFRNPSQLDQGGQAYVEHLRMRSGFSIIASEYAPPSVTMPPTAPTRAKYAITMPQGASIVVDEPADGQTTVTVTHPQGASLTIDASGKVTLISPTEVLLQAPDVQLGAEGGKTLAFFAELNALTSWAATHTHTGVQSGSSTSGTPMTSPPTPVGTQDTFAT